MLVDDEIAVDVVVDEYGEETNESVDESEQERFGHDVGVEKQQLVFVDGVDEETKHERQAEETHDLVDAPHVDLVEREDEHADEQGHDDGELGERQRHQIVEMVGLAEQSGAGRHTRRGQLRRDVLAVEQDEVGHD